VSSAARTEEKLPSGARDSGAGRRDIGARFTGDSLLWLILVSGLFVLAELSPALLRMSLGTDEITYLAQTSLHSSQVILPPVHSRGAGLLAAPVTLLTTSLLAVRLWLASLSGAGLFLALFAWRGLRRAWTLAVAGAILGSLAISQLSGVQVMPDWWQALGALALAGLFMQAVTGRMRGIVVLPLLAAVTFFLVLMRFQNAAFVVAPVIAAALIVPAWRSRRVLAAIGIGIAVAAAEWIAESYAWYGGPVGRMHLSAQEPPKFGVYFSLPYQLRVLNGPWYCRPGACHGWQYPWLDLWWLALLALIVVGVFTARRMALTSSAVPVAAALSVLAGYVLFEPFAAPRYLLPVVALLTIPAADGMAWLAGTLRWRAGAAALIAAFLLTGAVGQHFVLQSEVTAQSAVRASFIRTADHLREHGARPPCVASSTAVAYYLGCAAPWTGEHMHQVLTQSPGGPRAWRKLPGTKISVYVKR
jgi:hypothetical protein